VNHKGWIGSTGSCSGGACFQSPYTCQQINDGLGKKVTADATGAIHFPNTWSIKLGSRATLKFSSCASPSTSDVGSDFQGDVKVTISDPISDPQTRCYLSFETLDSSLIYHEHFAANPNSRCLGWVECKELEAPEAVLPKDLKLIPPKSSTEPPAEDSNQ
jgi:hypothetical protein